MKQILFLWLSSERETEDITNENSDIDVLMLYS